MLTRGTTPTITFTVPFDAADITQLNICFQQRGRMNYQGENNVLEKTLSDCTIEGDKIKVELSELDTLQFDQNVREVCIQLRVGIGEKRLASQIIQTTVGEILKDGVLE